ncbi:hypothetical protein I7I53_12007 [Histoplasma capsulatum var. duboisii H88]|uniref:Uncharacterized protein n=1 Tax=Ajellomyces capsulatus (strain H88) TaxID=544711 RepID=A0A8A1LU52_AJEC8|nr:hypothetical protein I7I53_12007 [Histoplasma capsulatum var. duboisii H88]
MFISALMLQLFDSDKYMILKTDISDYIRGKRTQHDQSERKTAGASLPLLRGEAEIGLQAILVAQLTRAYQSDSKHAWASRTPGYASQKSRG